MKTLVPAGFMPVVSGNTITIQICSGLEHQTVEWVIPGLPAHPEDQNHHGKTEMPCAFSGLNAPGMAATDPVLLVLAIAFIMIVSRHVAAIPGAPEPDYLRPPLRGPPVTA